MQIGLFDNLTPEEGTCQCCGQKIKVYRRNIFSNMAYWLIRLVQINRDTDDWVHVGDLTLPSGRDAGSNGGAFSMLRYWGLIEPKMNRDKSKRCSGFWKPTNMGFNFVMRNDTVIKFCHTYNMQIMNWSGPEVDIVECLGERFDYEELMSR